MENNTMDKVDLTNLKIGDTVHLRCGGSIVVRSYEEECNMGSCYVNGIGYLPNGEHDTAHMELDIISITPKPEPKRIKGWLNIYPSNTKIGDRLYNNRDEANINAHSSRFACIQIDVAEGEGL